MSNNIFAVDILIQKDFALFAYISIQICQNKQLVKSCSLGESINIIGLVAQW